MIFAPCIGDILKSKKIPGQFAEQSVQVERKEAERRNLSYLIILNFKKKERASELRPKPGQTKHAQEIFPVWHWQGL